MERVWREFGKHTNAGKLLYDLYGVKFKPEEHINYPKITTTRKEPLKIENEVEKNKTKRNKTSEKILSKISYPKIEMKKPKQYHKIDLIYKRKNQNEIMKDFEKIKQEIKPPTINNTKNTNRKEQIEKLQDKFQYGEKTYLPMRARPPKINLNEEDEEKYKTNIEILNEKNLEKLKEKGHSLTNDNYEDEYSKLHKKIMVEIDERYKFMEDMKKLGDESRNVELMSEIKSRIKELRTLEKLRLKNNIN